MLHTSRWYCTFIVLSGLCCMLCCGATVTPASAVAQSPADKEHHITGIVCGIIRYTDCFGFELKDDKLNTVTVVISDGNVPEFQDITPNSIVSLRYTTELLPPTPFWPHKTRLNTYVDNSGKIIKLAPAMHGGE